ncbi:succinyl-CoA synthetase alpha subunit [Rhodoligotrophos appendicifer]|uniref:succinate--CoA ligase subunit alpha n=1 Tax=Rhodoligotrophos appendicifer TaxID=987056 RepID=UPI001180B366|nr:succinate--CoA ligase subunit alpha [Rhodoligotrophos appendicifer]
MAILLDRETRAVIHGIQGKYSRAQLGMMLKAGTRIVAGISVGGAGGDVDGIPVFDDMTAAAAATRANTALLYVPASGLLHAIRESVDAGMRLVIAAAENAPVQDAMDAAAYARSKGTWLVGPNSLGMVIPGFGMLGSYSLDFAQAGPVGLISRSGSISVSASRLLAQAGLGHSACIHIGGDYICGRNPHEYLEAFEQDPATRVTVYCGEVGGTKEYEMARCLGHLSKPLVAMIVGRAAQPEKKLGHAGALVLSERDTAEAKRRALRAAGAHVADSLPHLVQLCRDLLEPAGRGARVA